MVGGVPQTHIENVEFEDMQHIIDQTWNITNVTGNIQLYEAALNQTKTNNTWVENYTLSRVFKGHSNGVTKFEIFLHSGSREARF